MSGEALVIRRVLDPHWVSPRCPLPASAIEVLEDAATSSDCDNCTLAGVSSDGRMSWLARGNHLEVIDINSYTRLAAWRFCAELSGSMDVCVRAVCEFHMQRDSILAIAIQLGLASSEICLFDPSVCRVIKAISCPYVITSLEPVATFQEVVDVSTLLNKALQCFTGILAVGTETGRVILVDLRLDDESEMFTESRPSPLDVVTRLNSVKQQRREALEKGCHLYIELRGNDHDSNQFHFVLPNGQTVKTLDESSVSVTAIKCIHRIGCIAIGYSFGSFQLWHLGDLQILCSHSEETLMSPITHFAYQEPEDDPRSVCYIWMGRGPTQSALRSNDPASLCLYQMMFATKEMVNGFGLVYQGLQNFGPRFLYPLSFNPLSPSLSAASGSHIISCSCIGDSAMRGEWSDENDGHDIEAVSHDRKGNIMCVVWENDRNSGGSSCILGLFDLDRWYHSQMPGAFKLGGDSPEKGCSFFTMYSLSSVLTACEPDQLTNVWVDPSSVSWFVHVGDVPVEMLMPSAINLDAVCLAETGIIKVKIYGIQQRVLDELNRLGPRVLSNPSDMFTFCWMSGLLSKGGDKKQLQDKLFQCESLLSILLENSQLSFLTSCVETLSSADFGQSGFTLRSLLQWCLQKMHDIKKESDNTCMGMFNGHCMAIDQHLERQLLHYSTQFDHLKLLFEALSSHSAPTTQQGLKDLGGQMTAVTLVKQRFDAIMWLVSTKHLPELSEDRLPSANMYQFPYGKLSDHCDQLRNSTGGPDGLLIDQLVAQLESNALNRWWGTEFKGNGHYPPPSLYALLNVYYIESAPHTLKLSIVYYLLLDLSRVSEDTYSERTVAEQFVTAFSLRGSLWRTVRGVWLLDHGDFESAVRDLTHPSVTENLFPWLQTAVLETLMRNDQPELAGQYLTVAQPPVDGLDDIKLRMRVLLTNGLVGDAFDYQHHFTDLDMSEELLECFVDSCLKCKSMDELLQLPFSSSEETAVEACLKNSGKAEHLELLVMHYLQRGRHVDAIHLNEKINTELAPTGSTEADRAVNRNSIVAGYMKTLPLVQSVIAGTDIQLPTYPKTVQYSKPTPLSVVIRPGRTDGQVLSQAAVVAAVFDKIEETRSQIPEPATPFRRGEFGQRIHSYCTPFTGTPLSARNQLRTRPATPVVFLSERLEDEHMPLVAPSPIQPRQFGSPGVAGRIQALKDRVLSSMMRSTGRLSEPQSLLTTPTLKTSPLSAPMVPSMLSTPHSILKVREPFSADDPEPLEATKQKKHLSFNLSPDGDDDSSLVSVSPLSSSLPSSRKQTRFAPTERSRDGDNTEDDHVSLTQASLEDSDREVSFNIRIAPRWAASTSISSGTTTVPDSQSEDDTDTGVHHPPCTESEVSVGTGQVQPARSPPSPSEKLAKLKELRQRTEMIMEKLRSSPQPRLSHKEGEDENGDRASLNVASSPPHDLDDDSFQSAVSDLQSPAESFVDASSFTPPPSPRATNSVTPRGSELEPIAEKDSREEYTSPFVSVAHRVGESLHHVSEPLISVAVDRTDGHFCGHADMSTTVPTCTAFQTLQSSMLGSSSFVSPRRATKLVIAKSPRLSKELVPVQSPYTFAQPTVLSPLVTASRSDDEEMEAVVDSAVAETPEFAFSPPLTRSARRHNHVERDPSRETPTRSQVLDGLLPVQMSPSRDRQDEITTSAFTTPVRRSRRLQGISPHVPPSDTPLRLFPLDNQTTISTAASRTGYGTVLRRGTREKSRLPDRRELGMRLRHRITRPKKTTMK